MKLMNITKKKAGMLMREDTMTSSIPSKDSAPVNSHEKNDSLQLSI
jgi:hypothetical protein